MQAFITKYALTSGIIAVEIDGETSSVNNDGKFLRCKLPSATYHQYFGHTEWFLDSDAATKVAEQLREKKIQSLEKQIAKLRKLAFA